MEKKVCEKAIVYSDNMKNEIRTWINNNDNIDNSTKNEFLEFVYTIGNLSFTKEDFAKRKRVKTHVPQYMRCNANRANGEQCTRKRKDGNLYCGTHDKNRPHGVIDSGDKKEFKKVEVFLQDINGILYYIDNNGNIYTTEDIIDNKINPGIYGKYILEDGFYKIME